jgi:hypothetical protein
VTDTARLLLVAAALSASALAVFVWRLLRIDAADPARLIGELRLAQSAAILLAFTGGAWLGLGVAHEAELLSGVDLSIAIVYAILAIVVLQLEPRQALLVLAGAFVVHALVDIGHRPDGLSTTIAPRWFIVGCAAFDVYVGALCFWARRR